MGKIMIIKGADFSEVAVTTVTPVTNKKRINLSSSPEGGGTLSGAGLYDVGEQVEIKATANVGYRFSQWNDGNTESTRTITVGDSDVTYTATFVEIVNIQFIERIENKLMAGNGSIRDFTDYGIDVYSLTDVSSISVNSKGSGVNMLTSTFPKIVFYNGPVLGSDNKVGEAVMGEGYKDFVGIVSVPEGATHIGTNVSINGERYSLTAV